MNRLVIPSILAATVLVAGVFTLMPVDKASTVHTTIQNTVIRATNTLSDADWDIAGAEDEKQISCTAPAIIHELNFDISGTLAGGDDINLVIDPDGATATFVAVTQADIFGGVAPASEVTLLSTRALSQGVALQTGGTLSLTLTAEAADNGNEAVDITALYSSQGTCTIAEA